MGNFLRTVALGRYLRASKIRVPHAHVAQERARAHNVTMQIAGGSRQKCLLARFAVGAAPKAADFNYESSATDRRARAEILSVFLSFFRLAWPVAHSKFGSCR